MSETRSPPHAGEEESTPAEEEEEEESTSHPRGGRRGGDSREVVGMNSSIRHSDFVRQVGASGDKCSNFRRQAERTRVSESEALKIGIFERGLTPLLYERQRLRPYCRTMQESSDRAQRSAATLEHTVDKTVSALWSTVTHKKPQQGRGRSSTTTPSTVHMNRKRSRSNQRGKKSDNFSRARSPSTQQSQTASQQSQFEQCSHFEYTSKDKSGHSSQSCFDHPQHGAANKRRFHEYVKRSKQKP